MIEVSSLCKCYGSRTALRNVSFTVRDGEVTGLLGLNGAGKSTAMNIIAGCLSGTSGTVLVDGIDIEAEPDRAKKNIGYLPEIPPLYPDMKVSEYLGFICDIKKVKAKRKATLEEIVRQTGLENVYGRLVKNLSKGYKQRVGLAAALAGSPRTIILDEPTVGLDPSQIIEIRSLIRSLGEQCTVLLSSHILSEIQAVCGRVIVLDRGTVAADGRPEDIAAPGNSGGYTAVIEGNPRTVADVLSAVPGVTAVKELEAEGDNVRAYEIAADKSRDIRRDVSLALAERGCILLSTRRSGPGLEQFFLELAGGGTEARTNGAGEER